MSSLNNKWINRAISGLTAVLVAVSMVSCSASVSTDQAVTVQSVSMLMGMDLTGNNRYSGVTEAKSTQKIAKDSDKTIEECKVEVGDEVHVGDVLFTYDVEALNLSVESAKLEVEQTENSIDSYTTQISELEKEKASASSDQQLEYTLQIQEAQLNLAEAQYSLKQKQTSLEQLEKDAENTDVKATVDGVVQSISNDDTSGSETYMTIMETGTYRIKGTVSENNVYDLYQEMPVTVQSRTDSSQVWSGTITEIDTGSTDSDSDESSMYSDYSDGESTTRYSFYVTLDDSSGLMMGQHVYIYPEQEMDTSSIMLSSAFIVQEGDNAYVWAADDKDQLEKRPVVLGPYDESTDCYLIEDGLTLDDFVADVSDSLEEGVPVVKNDGSVYSTVEEDSETGYGEEFYSDDTYYEETDNGEEYTEDEYFEDDTGTDESVIGGSEG